MHAYHISGMAIYWWQTNAHILWSSPYLLVVGNLVLVGLTLCQMLWFGAIHIIYFFNQIIVVIQT